MKRSWSLWINSQLTVFRNVMAKAERTLDVGDQVAVDDAGARKKSGLDAGAELRLRVASRGTRREGHVGASGIGVDEEHLSAGHGGSLAKSNPGVGGGRLDLEVDVS